MTQSPEIVILNGALCAFDPAFVGGDAVAISGGRIVAIGASADIKALVGPGTRVIDAGGATVLPGFIDAHVHLFHGAATLGMLDLKHVQGLDRLIAAVRPYAAHHPDDPLICAASASYDMIAPGVNATRHDLDKVIADRPLVLIAADLHTVWCNTRALEQAGLLHGAVVPEGSEILMGVDGTAIGQLNETGAFGPVLKLSTYGGRDLMGYVTGADPDPAATPAERSFDKTVLEQGLAHCAAQGITGLHNMDGNFYQLELLAELEAEGRLPMRVQVPFHLKNYDPLDRLEEAAVMHAQYASSKLWSGRVKMFMDGVLDSYTAFMVAPYPGRPDSIGEAVFEADHFNEVCIRADKMGLQISVHAVGDGAVRRVLDGYEAAQRVNGVRDSRHRLEHIEVIDPEDLPRLADLGAVASMQPLHAPWGKLFEPYSPGNILRDAQYAYSFPWNQIRRSGAKLCFSTDWPVVPQDVMGTVAAAVKGRVLPDRWVRNDQSLHDVLASYTRDNAWLEFSEGNRGQLKQGFDADITIMDQNLFDMPTEDLSTAKAQTTICAGAVSYEA